MANGVQPILRTPRPNEIDIVVVVERRATITAILVSTRHRRTFISNEIETHRRLRETNLSVDIHTRVLNDRRPEFERLKPNNSASYTIIRAARPSLAHTRRSRATRHVHDERILKTHTTSFGGAPTTNLRPSKNAHDAHLSVRTVSCLSSRHPSIWLEEFCVTAVRRAIDA